jgi:hypothetical protein
MSAAKKTFTLEEIHDILRDQPPKEFFADSRISEATIAVLGRFAGRQYMVFEEIAEKWEAEHALRNREALAREEAHRADN